MSTTNPTSSTTHNEAAAGQQMESGAKLDFSNFSEGITRNLRFIRSFLEMATERAEQTPDSQLIALLEAATQKVADAMDFAENVEDDLLHSEAATNRGDVGIKIGGAA